jgi:hypothetical protein
MLSVKNKLIWLLSPFVVQLVGPRLNVEPRVQEPARQTTREPIGHYFSVRDSIEMSRFEIVGGQPKFSPDNKYFFVITSRGILQSDKIESTLWVFRTEEVSDFVRAELPSKSPRAWPIVRRAAIPKNSYSIPYQSIVSNVRWEADSKGLLFLAQNSSGELQLCRADLASGSVHPLTPAGYDVTQFDFAQDTIVYIAAPSRQHLDEVGVPINADSRNVTGEPLASFLPGIDEPAKYCELWVIRNGRNWQIKAPTSARAIQFLNHFPDILSISPDGRFVVALLPSATVPVSWESYEPAYAYLKLRSKDPSTTSQSNFTRPAQYAIFGLRGAKTEFVVNAPHGYALGYIQKNAVVWSLDGKKLMLTNTFLPLNGVNETEKARRLLPCATAIVDLGSKSTSCIAFSRYTPTNASSLVSASFGKDSNEAVLAFSNSSNKPEGELYHYENGDWHPATLSTDNESDRSIKGGTENPKEGFPGLAAAVRESPNNPPTLWATDLETGRSRRIWDPNPGLSAFRLGEVSPFQWKDKSGYQWLGQLVKPPDYIPGRRYPLVIQTYGFADGFVSDGLFPTAYAARPLTSVGIAVLQMPRRTDRNATAEEASVQLVGFQAAIAHLDSEGMIDPQKVGIIGFSRTCYHVENALIRDPKLFAAATLADGFDASYVTYLYSAGNATNIDDDIYGVKPFGAGLEEWMERAPGFNLDKVQTPVRIEAIGLGSILAEWETYGSLLEQGKAVDLIYYPFGDHLLQKPLERMGSQQGNVDWFRFWLKGEEDSDPVKAAQYSRWRELRKLQEQNHSNVPTK